MLRALPRRPRRGLLAPRLSAAAPPLRTRARKERSKRGPSASDSRERRGRGRERGGEEGGVQRRQQAHRRAPCTSPTCRWRPWCTRPRSRSAARRRGRCTCLPPGPGGGRRPAAHEITRRAARHAARRPHRTFFMQPSMAQRPFSPCTQHLPSRPVTLILQPGTSHRLPPPCAQHLSVLPCRRGGIRTAARRAERGRYSADQTWGHHRTNLGRLFTALRLATAPPAVGLAAPR